MLTLSNVCEKSIVNSLTARFYCYLTGRTQSISVDDTISEPVPIQFGVSQGSVLGPLLFIMYINNLPLAVRACSKELYADDTLIFLLVNLLAKFNLHRLISWFRSNCSVDA